ncbi:MAG: hypothetical protein J6W62_06130 [Spirochaetia bacterium]|nr:hypothetical protein [Spirochaetia bacterium]
MLEEQIQELTSCYHINRKLAIKKFVELSHSQLSLIEDTDGEVIYSSKDTFKKGRYYFLGLNPGGTGKIKIRDHLDGFPTRTDNSFLDEEWNIETRNYPKGNNPLQLRVKYLFSEYLLNYVLQDVFATNLIFKTTPTSDSLNYGLAGLCWGVHLLALSIVQPEIIITCGNSQDKSAFSFISDLYAGKIECHKLAGTFCIKETRIIIQNRPTLLIGLPHLSLFEIRNNEDCRKKLLEIVNKYDSDKK